MTRSPRVVLVAMPLMARSGVYRSTHDLVRAALSAGLDWSAVIGMRPTATGRPLITPGVREVELSGRGWGGVAGIRELVDTASEVRAADVIITMIPQSDIAVMGASARQGRIWVAWVRGKPWPAAGEQSALRRGVLRLVETRALKAADDVWATTPVLAEEFASASRAEIIPAGIASVARTSWGLDASGPLVWAGRVDIDKRPQLFAEIVARTSHPGRIFGDGPLHAELSRRPVPGLVWEGWSEANDLWREASIFVGTSLREAFGRSAVEAAASGLPVVLGAAYGAAPLLVTSKTLRAICVVSSDDPEEWAKSVNRLLHDGSLRKEVSEHVYINAQRLTIGRSIERANARLTGRMVVSANPDGR